ncbi:hypothetical protein GQ457_02G041750 [Hibiscus cannabinus]
MFTKAEPFSFSIFQLLLRLDDQNSAEEGYFSKVGKGWYGAKSPGLALQCNVVLYLLPRGQSNCPFPFKCENLLFAIENYHFMAQREEGWPLGLEPLNARIGLLRNPDFSASTLITSSSPTSCSDLDTQSTGSFFHDKSITLGSLLLSRTSTRKRTTQTSRHQKNNCKPRTWFFSLCSKLSTDAVDTSIKSQSLGHFLQVERRAAAHICTRNHQPIMLPAQPNSLFVGDRIAPRSNAESSAGDGRKSDRQPAEHGKGDGVPLLLSCLYPMLLH